MGEDLYPQHWDLHCLTRCLAHKIFICCTKSSESILLHWCKRYSKEISSLLFIYTQKKMGQWNCLDYIVFLFVFALVSELSHKDHPQQTSQIAQYRAFSAVMIEFGQWVLNCIPQSCFHIVICMQISNSVGQFNSCTGYVVGRLSQKPCTLIKSLGLTLYDDEVL